MTLNVGAFSPHPSLKTSGHGLCLMTTAMFVQVQEDTASESPIIRDTILQGSFYLGGRKQKDELDVDSGSDSGSEHMLDSGTMLRSLLYIVLLNLHHNSSRWVSLTFIL